MPVMLPPSFAKDGYISQVELVKRRRGPLIGTEGETDTGKSEFILSCPGPGKVICLDRQMEAVLHNPNPPKSRRQDFGIKMLQVPLALTAQQEVFAQYWQLYRDTVYAALADPAAVTVGLDGETDAWELQRLAKFGKLTQIPSILYTEVNMAKKAFISRCHDSGKVIVATHKVKAMYKTKLNPDGSPQYGNDGKELREKSGELERQGFGEQDYLWAIQLRHFIRPAAYNKVSKKEIPAAYGITILKCKPNPSIVGSELTGPDCCFAGLMDIAYPNLPLSFWGL